MVVVVAESAAAAAAADDGCGSEGSSGFGSLVDGALPLLAFLLFRRLLELDGSESSRDPGS